MSLFKQADELCFPFVFHSWLLGVGVVVIFGEGDIHDDFWKKKKKGNQTDCFETVNQRVHIRFCS